MRSWLLRLTIFVTLLVAPLVVSSDDVTISSHEWLLPDGRYEGLFESAGAREALVLRVFSGGALLDLPAEGLYGYPLPSFYREGGRFGFLLGSGEAAPRFEGTLSRGDEGELVFAGAVSLRGERVGAYTLRPAPEPHERGEPFSLAVKGGELRGSLLVPEGAGPFPLCILVAGAGSTDRDGNNYNVPGKNDALALLARALKDEGVATLRYDKRGAGESYPLVRSEEELSFDDYIEDCATVYRAVTQDARFSRVTLVGHAEGALIAAVASQGLEARGEAAPAGLALLCATGKNAREVLDEALADAPEEERAEAAAILGAIERGERYEHPSPYLADFFRPSFQKYLGSWFRHDLIRALAGVRTPLLLVQGNRDVQVTLAEFSLLAAARPEAPAVVLPGMNHVLKEVPADLEENYRSFSEPGYPLAEGLATLIAQFARGEAPDASYMRMDGAVLPE